jgi:DNA-binding SARP family transcriptional activator
MTGPSARVSLLDGFEVSVGCASAGEAADCLPHGAQRLIAHLGLCGRTRRGAVAGELWPDASEAHAHGSLRSALWRVQRAVPGLIDASGGTVALAEGVRVDVRDLVDRAHSVLTPGARTEAVDTPVTALAGELLPGWYDDWVLLERERLRQLRMHALEVLADTLVLAGRYGEAVQAAYAAVRDEPLRESAHRALVRVHLAEGNLAEALRAYGAFRDLLGRELGVLPSCRMEALLSQGRAGGGGRVVLGAPGPGPVCPSPCVGAPAG